LEVNPPFLDKSSHLFRSAVPGRQCPTDEMIAMKKKQSMWRFNVIIVTITLSLVGGLEHEFYDFPFS